MCVASCCWCWEQVTGVQSRGRDRPAHDWKRSSCSGTARRSRARGRGVVSRRRRGSSRQRGSLLSLVIACAPLATGHDSELHLSCVLRCFWCRAVDRARCSLPSDVSRLARVDLDFVSSPFSFTGYVQKRALRFSSSLQAPESISTSVRSIYFCFLALSCPRIAPGTALAV